jgi:hypothetical protein
MVGETTIAAVIGLTVVLRTAATDGVTGAGTAIGVATAAGGAVETEVGVFAAVVEVPLSAALLVLASAGDNAATTGAGVLAEVTATSLPESAVPVVVAVEALPPDEVAEPEDVLPVLLVSAAPFVSLVSVCGFVSTAAAALAGSLLSVACVFSVTGAGSAALAAAVCALGSTFATGGVATACRMNAGVGTS